MMQPVFWPQSNGSARPYLSCHGWQRRGLNPESARRWEGARAESSHPRATWERHLHSHRESGGDEGWQGVAKRACGWPGVLHLLHVIAPNITANLGSSTDRWRTLALQTRGAHVCTLLSARFRKVADKGIDLGAHPARCWKLMEQHVRLSVKIISPYL